MNINILYCSSASANSSFFPAGLNNSTRVIAINTTWGTYRTSVDAIEAATGLDILSAVPTAVQQAIEARTDNGPTS